VNFAVAEVGAAIALQGELALKRQAKSKQLFSQNPNHNRYTHPEGLDN
jgi:hypothetical protein